MPDTFIGISYGAIPFFVVCVDNNFHHVDVCKNLKVCVKEETTYYQIVYKCLPERRIVKITRQDGGGFGGFIMKKCNVIVDNEFWFGGSTVRGAS